MLFCCIIWWKLVHSCWCVCSPICYFARLLVIFSLFSRCRSSLTSYFVLFVLKVRRYASSLKSSQVLQGKLSCLHRGLAFCKTQIHHASRRFQQTTKCPSLVSHASTTHTESDDVEVLAMVAALIWTHRN